MERFQEDRHGVAMDYPDGGDSGDDVHYGGEPQDVAVVEEALMPPGICQKCGKETVVNGACRGACSDVRQPLTEKRPDALATAAVNSGAPLTEPERIPDVQLVAGEECPTCGYKVPEKSTERVKRFRAKGGA